MSPSPQISAILERMAKGDSQAMGELFPLVYEELRRMARFYLQRGGTNNTLQATALVNEIYLAMAGKEVMVCENSAHFFNTAALAMRRYLFDHAAKRNRRAKLLPRVNLESMDGSAIATADPDEDAIDHEALDAAMVRLEAIDKRRYQVVMLRYYAGLHEQAIAEQMGITQKTVQRDWATAKLFLRAQLETAR